MMGRWSTMYKPIIKWALTAQKAVEFDQFGAERLDCCCYWSTTSCSVSRAAVGCWRKMASSSSSTSEIIAKLKLKPHQEGGYFAETFRDASVFLSKSQLPPQYKVGRPVSTSIYFLVPSGSVSHLHRIPCAETWHFYAGEPITIVELNEKDGRIKLTCLGPKIGENEQPQYVVPPYVWFGSFLTSDARVAMDGTFLKAEPRDAEKHFSLVGCTCAPAFQFEDFELAKRTELLAQFPDHEPLITFLTFPE